MTGAAGKNTIKDLRKRAQLTQKQVGDALGVSCTTVHLIENGCMDVTPEMKKKIKALFGQDAAIPYTSQEYAREKAAEISALAASRKKPRGVLRTLKEIRLDLGVAQKDIAAAVGVCISTICGLESGKWEANAEIYRKLADLFDEDIALKCRVEAERTKSGKEGSELDDYGMLTTGERKFLRTCYNMRDALKGGRMNPRDLVDATFEFMDECEAVTYLYKWYKTGFYHYPKGTTIDQGYFLWEKMPKAIKKVVFDE